VHGLFRIDTGIVDLSDGLVDLARRNLAQPLFDGPLASLEV